jgi:hypothetical protein
MTIVGSIIADDDDNGDAFVMLDFPSFDIGDDGIDENVQSLSNLKIADLEQKLKAAEQTAQMAKNEV